MTIPLPEIPIEAPEQRVLKLEARIAQQAAFVQLLMRNGEAVLATIGQDVLKDLQRSMEAASTGQATAKEEPPGR
jgi:hypothetical protein